MKKYLIPVAVVVGVLVAIALVVLGGGGDGTDSATGLARDPMTGKTEFDIPVQDPQLVAEGEVLYQSACAVCHGSDLRGTPLGPSHLSVIYNPEHHGDGAFAVAVVNGVKAHHWGFGDMPPRPDISQEDFVRLIAFIRETQRVEGFEAYPPP